MTKREKGKKNFSRLLTLIRYLVIQVLSRLPFFRLIMRVNEVKLIYSVKTWVNENDDCKMQCTLNIDRLKIKTYINSPVLLVYYFELKFTIDILM